MPFLSEEGERSLIEETLAKTRTGFVQAVEEKTVEKAWRLVSGPAEEYLAKRSERIEKKYTD
ncbi:hypothetical protein DIPPA_28088 [Diplonema papillatum]|nr:hypothetical protein DIPPA_28088 [Diplonema papillatum]